MFNRKPISIVMLCGMGSFALLVRQGLGQTPPLLQKPEFPKLKPVVIVKRGQTSTVQWAWESHNGRAEQWYVLKDATPPDENNVDYMRDQRKLEIDGVHIEADRDQSNHLGDELFKNGAYTDEQKKYANTFVKGAVFRVSAAKNAPLGGRTVFVHNISGTGFPAEFRLRAELRILVMR